MAIKADAPDGIRKMAEAPIVVHDCAAATIEGAPYKRTFNYESKFNDEGYALTREDFLRYQRMTFACIRSKGVPVQNPPTNFPADSWFKKLTMRGFIIWANGQVIKALKGKKEAAGS